MSLHLLSAGMLTSVQSLGRSGYRHLGVGNAGALDEVSLRVANLLVGNAADAAALEITLQGPRLRFDRAVRIALAGADIQASVGDEPIPGWRPVDLPAGAELVLGTCRRGARAYLAIAGGVIVPAILGSASTDLRGGFGGMRGRALAAGDVLPIGRGANKPADALQVAGWWVEPRLGLDFSQPACVRLLPGSDGIANATQLFAGDYRVSTASNRQGLRLEGAALTPVDEHERISGPVAPGAVQLPPDGQPIVLLADAQTVGGYPCIGHAIGADFSRLAQLRPGERLRFEAIDREHARRLACEQRQGLARIALAIQARTRQHSM